ncbi:kelch repeat and BTB domain-containing protein 2-like [Branchiostoma lanceolatum]|uniref:kelch repeat and BTB domain-containing protein 2-like n=1 Tax=Branchiostoma lanceolatum TaxID=7740 RepID=UPI0034514A36
MAAADQEPRASAVHRRSYQDKSYLHGFLGSVGDFQNDRAFQDVILEVEGRRFPCHRLVLSAASPYFRAMFTNDMAERRQKKVVLQCLDARIFREILSYIYSGTFHVSLYNVQPLYQAADFLQLDYVRDTCSSYMVENVGVESSNCVDLYKFAGVFSVDIVLKRCQQWIYHNFAEVASSEEFCSLSVNQLIDIISYDELHIKKETIVWEAVVRWVKHSREDRLHHLPIILPHIRFNLLTSDDTAAILEHPLVREDPGSSEVIRNMVQKENYLNLKPRDGMTTEMALLSSVRSNQMFCINPKAGKFFKISCNDVPQVLAKAVTNDSDIYILTEASDFTEASDSEDQLSLFKYNEFGNRWEQKSSVRCVRGDGRPRVEHLVDAGGHLYYLARVVDRSSGTEEMFMAMERYDQHTDQWHSCSRVDLGGWEHDNQTDTLVIKDYTVVSCDRYIYIFSDTEMHRYDSSLEFWYRLIMPRNIPQFCTAVAKGTNIFCANFDFSKRMVYNTERQGWFKYQAFEQIDEGHHFFTDSRSPGFFVLEKKLHLVLSCRDETTGSDTCRICFYDKSKATWSGLRLPTALPPELRQCASPSPVARMYLPYFKSGQMHA